MYIPFLVNTEAWDNILGNEFREIGKGKLQNWKNISFSNEKSLEYLEF